MNEDQIRKTVDERCDFFQKDTGREVTDGARKLIATVIALISEDPHPTWREKNDPDTDTLQRRLIEGLPLILMRTTADLWSYPRRYELEPVKGSISSFDLLHRMTPLVDLFCPFRKR